MTDSRDTFAQEAVLSLVLSSTLLAMPATAAPLDAWVQPSAISISTARLGVLARDLEVGDLVFIRIGALPFREVASASRSWTNHVGIVVAAANGVVQVAESAVPLSRITSLERFAGRSQEGRLAVMRRTSPLDPEEKERIRAAASARLGIFYDTGFDAHSRRQFCSRYVRDVMHEADVLEVGRIETFRTLLAQNPDAKLGFWKLWYFGWIPWDRETITPQSVLESPGLAAGIRRLCDERLVVTPAFKGEAF